MPKLEKVLTLEITPEQFLNNCSPVELQELEILLSSNFYQNRIHNAQQCRICGCTEYDCRECIKSTGTPCHWIEKDLCSRCNNEILKIEYFYERSLFMEALSNRLQNSLYSFFRSERSISRENFKIKLLQNLDLNEFSKQRGNGPALINELVKYCTDNKIKIIK